MLGPSDIIHIMRIGRVIARYRLLNVLFPTPSPRWIHWVFYLLPWHWVSASPYKDRGDRIRYALEELGPVFIKLGQALSTRRDLLPPDVADSLAYLQDHVKPFDSKKSRQIIETSLQKPINTIFKSLDSEPLAAASVAQVYGGVLHNGKNIVVKIIRPGIDKIIQRDIRLMQRLARLVQWASPEARRLKPLEVVREFQHTITNELNLKREAANANLMRQHFENSELIYVPEVHWDYVSENVMVLERVYGIPISHIDELNAKNVNLKVLAERGVEIFFTQVFVHNFFHADMHPGNIFVDASKPDSPRYIAMDFGIMGTMNNFDRQYMADNFIAFFNRDYQKVAELHIDSKWIGEDTRTDEFEAAIRTLCEPIFEKPLKEISFGHFMVQLFQIAREYNYQVQPQLVLFEKTLLQIEGLGRQLYPELDLWSTAKPFMKKTLLKETGVKAFWQQALKQLPGTENLPDWIKELPDAPRDIHRAVQTLIQVDKQTIERENRHHELLKEIASLRKTVNRSVLIGAIIAGIFAGLYISRM